ncbi:A disintegrin and metalloproteinase with thrombospondin motifs 2-like [Tachysurus ichikawai]
MIISQASHAINMDENASRFRHECSRCRTDRSMLCNMAMLQQYCMIPAFQRICCKSCSADNTTSIAVATPTGLTLTTPKVSTRSQGFTVNTASPPSGRSITEGVAYTEYNAWEYTILTTGTKVEATTPSVMHINTASSFFTEPNTPTPVAMTTQTTSGNVTLSGIDVTIHNADTDNNSVSGLDELHVTTVTSPTADPDQSQVERDANPEKVGTLIQTSGDDELTTSGWHESETVTNISITTLMPTFEETSNPNGSIEQVTTSVTMSTTATTTTSSPTIHKVTTTRPANKEEENNAIEVQITGVDIEFPENNIIPRRGRVFLRERTRNKRIQELLEEKRNFLRRMKRAQGF